MHSIRDFRVSLNRLSAEEIVALTTEKKKFLVEPTEKSVRLHVSWAPTISNTSPSAIDSKKLAGKRKHRTQSLHEHSAIDITSNAVMDPSNAAIHGEHRMSAKIPPKSLPAKRRRSLSVFEERPEQTNEDFHSELLKKLNTPNRSLLPAGRRSIPDRKPLPLPEWKRIFNEFQEKAAQRKINQN